MSDFVQKPNTGRIWPNKRRETNDKAPHYTGKITVDRPGTFEIGVWVNYAAEGEVKDAAIKLSDPYVKKDEPQAAPRQPALNDEVPF